VIVKQKKFGMGGPTYPSSGRAPGNLDRGDRKAAVAALRRGIATGMTHIDTAEMYGDAELVIADAIRDYRVKNSSWSQRCYRATPRGAAPSRPASGR
jgi:diketogulonate reductase-like aldo/keto reductase